MGEYTPTDVPQWSAAQRIGFRFLFIYFLQNILTPVGLLGILVNELLHLHGRLSAGWKQVVLWFGKHVFGLTITIFPAGSGDTTFNYVEVFCWVMFAGVLTLIWSLIDRKRLSYPRLFEALRVVVRLFLAAMMILYGANKVIPLQFGTLSPTVLVKPVGEQSPMSMLWTFMAASPYYTSFTGTLELLGGLLLIFRRTTLLGALVSAGALLHVVTLNFCYDVPVKLFSSHLLAMAVFLILPDAKRLWDFFVMGRPITPRPLRPRFQSRWLNWSVSSLNIVFFLLVTVGLLGLSIFASWKYGPFAPRQPLHGIWDVVEFQRDGQVVPPLATDATRWKQVLIERAGDEGEFVIRPMSGEADIRKLELAEDTRQMTLSDIKDTEKSALTLTYEQPAPNVLLLSGIVDGKQVRAELHQVPESQFLLVNRGFHWINETPLER